MARLRKLTEKQPKDFRLRRGLGGHQKGCKAGGAHDLTVPDQQREERAAACKSCSSDPDKGLAKIAPAHPVVQGKLCPR
ncbi:hypothetical protein [Paracoccus yeei]|uniref:hypothetical protein n=1 Tax=Paracoccus yeei TaxID=147645 RepID=UPI0012FDE3CD|nr:hypothetical protein [Paracoccus yeei]